MGSNKSNSENSNESNWVKFLKIMKTIIIALFICFLPFALPILLKVSIYCRIFNSIAEFEKLIQVFSNRYMFIYLIIVMIIVIISFGKSVSFTDFFKNFIYKGKIGDKIYLEAKPVEENKRASEIFDKIIDISNNDVKETKTQVKDALSKKEEKSNENIKDEKIKELNILLENVRYFSAYNNTNHTCSDLLIYLYKRKSISKIEFEDKLREYYSKRIRGVNKKQKKECINRKIEEKIFNYKYLDIIEISDDNEYIILTDSGKKFVIDYLKKGVEEDV